MKILELGHVVLYVTNLEKMASFYRDVLGFPEVDRAHGAAVFSSGRTHHELLLIEIGGQAQQPRMRPGLYHIGFKVANNDEDLQQVYKELKEHNVRIVGTADHTVTHSIYILDPDENELELYADVSDEWREDPKSIMAPVRPLSLDS